MRLKAWPADSSVTEPSFSSKESQWKQQSYRNVYSKHLTHLESVLMIFSSCSESSFFHHVVIHLSEKPLF